MSRLRELYTQKEARAWSGLVATLNDPNLIAVVLFCLIALLVTAGGLRWELQRPTHAALEPLCFVHTCFDV
jgi:hypothetical protein